MYDLGPVDLSVGDLFARRPRSRSAIIGAVHRPAADGRTTGIERPDQWGGVERAKPGLSEDPSRFAGVRPYAPGDPLRRVHPRASARLGTPVTKRFEPSRDREVLIVLDVQVRHGPAWEIAFEPDEVEALHVVAASIARALATERAAFGIAAAGFTGAESRFAHVPISSSAGRPSGSSTCSPGCRRTRRRRSSGCSRWSAGSPGPGRRVLVVTARDPPRSLAGSGGSSRAAAGSSSSPAVPRPSLDAGRARAAGFSARAARLNGPWRTAHVAGRRVVTARRAANASAGCGWRSAR